MTGKTQWPAGVEPRRPRVADNVGLGLFLGAAIGGATGAALSARQRDMAENAAIAAAGGAMLGMLAGAGVKPVSLERALQIALKAIGVDFVSLRRHGRYRAQVVFQTSKGFKVVEVTADPSLEWDSDDLDDWLYVQLVMGVLHKVEGK